MKVTANYIEQLLNTEIKISDELLNELKNDLYSILEDSKKQTDYREYLAGNIEKEFELSKELIEKIEPYVLSCVSEFIDDDKEKYDIIAWVNFQKKYEYNPMHTHGSLYSFVLWVNIPYNLKDEKELENCKYSNSKSNSDFVFFYANTDGKITPYHFELDKKDEGRLILFSASLNHQVYPFYTSDDYRISIAGNLYPRQSKQINSLMKYS